MAKFGSFVCISTVWLFGLLYLDTIPLTSSASSRTFSIDYEQNEFLKDGQVFRYVSGAMHYFRVPAELWRDRLRKIKFGGLNVVETYIEWSSIETSPGVYDFSGSNNITRFITEAQEEGLLVIVRPGPYICAERDMGGLPPWLLKPTPNIKPRTSDPNYLKPVDRWFNVLLPLLEPLLYRNGGPVIMVQVENEYGSYERSKCDTKYTTHLRDMMKRHLGNDTVLFTTDGNWDAYYKCGKIPQVFATMDFGIMSRANVSRAFAMLRRQQKQGPLVNSEFYSGWIDHWEREHQTRETVAFCDTLDAMLSMNASVNIYMYHGGTNFGFTAGGSVDQVYYPVPTTYDYDAPISEAGDLTPKFYAIKEVIKKYLPVEDEGTFSSATEKMQLPKVAMERKASIFELLPEPKESRDPLSFEQLNHSYGFVLYSAKINFQPTDPAVLSIPGLRDRAQVFLDKEFVGTLSTTRKILTLPLLASRGSTVDILVENQGRVFYGPLINQRKGIVSGVFVSNHKVLNWKHYRLFENWKEIIGQLSARTSLWPGGDSSRIASFYTGTFTLANKTNYPLDTFLQVSGWTKGVAFLNGHNLGRYWPVAGPQVTLYAPSIYFRPYPQANEVTLFELEQSPCSSKQNDDMKCSIQFVSKHIINGTIPTPVAKQTIKQESSQGFNTVDLVQ